MVRDFSKRVLLKIRNIFHKQIREGIGLYQYTTWIFLENFVKFQQLFLWNHCQQLGLNELLKHKQCLSSRSSILLKKILWCVPEKFGNFFKKAICQKNIFQLCMFHNAEAARTSLKKISIPGVFLSYGTPESFFNSCFINCY